jgi:hypothetical protein
MQVSPASQRVVAQVFPAVPGSQASWMHTPPGCVQIPQLALQQTLPLSHVVAPHF